MEMDKSCRTQGRDEKFKQNFNYKPDRKRTLGRPTHRMEVKVKVKLSLCFN